MLDQELTDLTRGIKEEDIVKFKSMVRKWVKAFEHYSTKTGRCPVCNNPVKRTGTHRKCDNCKVEWDVR